MTSRLDLLWVGYQHYCGRFYPLRDLIPLPLTRWIRVRVMPCFQGRLEMGLVGGGWCMTWRLSVTRVPVGSDL
jgi:hypothetical protein